MKKIVLILFGAAFFGCNNETNTDTTKGNSDTTIDSIAVKKDHTINKDTGIRVDSGIKDTSR